jgi:hypothetical protein
VPGVYGVLSIDESVDVRVSRIVGRRGVANAIGIENENIGALYRSRVAGDADVKTGSRRYGLHDDRHRVGLGDRARVDGQRGGLRSGRHVGVVRRCRARGVAVAEGPAVARDTDERT